MGAMNPFTEQNFYRIRDDNNSPDGGTPNWISSENQSTRTVISVDTPFRVRFVISNSGDAQEGGTFIVMYSHEGGAYNWASDSAALPVNPEPNAWTGGDSQTIATSNFVLSAGTGTATTGEYNDDSVSPGIATNLGAGDYWEIEFGLTINGSQVNDGDTIDLRIYAGSVALDQYDTNATALIQVSKGAAVGRGYGYIIH